MITDRETNIVYFSSLILQINKYKPFWNRLKPILSENKINYKFIENTRDIWCRDYMPIQTNENDFIQFTYFPDYYLTPKYISKLTIPAEIKADFKGNVKKSRLIIDGGNIVKSKTKIVVTEKILKDNSNLLPSTIKNELQNLLNINDIFTLPKFPYDYTGHSDGMVRFVDENKLLVSEFSSSSKSWQKKMNSVLNKIEKSGIKIIPFPDVQIDDKNKDGDYTAKGNYINFAQIGNYILFPQFDLKKEDSQALKKITEIYTDKDYKIIPVLSNEIANDGGVLNCITWNIKQ